MTSPLHISDAERRDRVVSRHHLGRTAARVIDAVRGVLALHSTDPATPYLAARARVPDFAIADLDRALFQDRSLWRLHAMRRTLFLVPATEVAVFEAGASRAVARKERQRLEQWLAAETGPKRAPGVLAGLEASVLETLDDGRERLTRELTAEIPELGMEITLGSGKWTTRAPVSSRILFLMAMAGQIVRTRPAGTWRSSQYHWAASKDWFDSVPHLLDPETGRVELARRYLSAFGPATLTDLRWWTGWTAKHARAAVAALDPVPVRLDGGGEAMMLPDEADVDVAGTGPPTVALLPALDPTPMGWKERDWFLGDHAGQLFDRSGNIGPSVWVDGRIVGGWGQNAGGEVAYRLLEDIGVDGERRVAEAAAEVMAWLDGGVVVPRFRTPLELSL